MQGKAKAVRVLQNGGLGQPKPGSRGDSVAEWVPFRLQHVQRVDSVQQSVTISWMEARYNNSKGQLSETLHRIFHTEFSAESIVIWRSALRRLAASMQMQAWSTR